jgi:hypothetical protein
VLKVFFTAGITAMIGILIFEHVGILDLSLIYINPTFLYSALVGGAIMGLGFIIGGFCPGTSMCAAAIGKIDAMAFILGSFLGVFAFAQGYPLFEELYLAEAWGPVLIYEQLGISKMFWAFTITAIAFIAFYVTGRIEDKVNKNQPLMPRRIVTRYAVSMGSAFVLIFLISFTPDKEQIIQNKIARAEEQQKCVFYEVPADELALEIANNHYKINVIDVRSPEEYEKYHIPLAINIPLEEIRDRKWERIFKQENKKNYFYADNDTTVRKACLLARHVGESQNYILRETVSQFQAMYEDPQAPGPNASKEEFNIYSFRQKAAHDMESLQESLKNINEPVVQEAVVVKGGCS